MKSMSTLLSAIQPIWQQLSQDTKAVGKIAWKTAKNVYNVNDVPSRLETFICIVVMAVVLGLIPASAGNVTIFSPLELVCVCLSISALVLIPILIRSIGKSVPELYQYVKRVVFHSSSQGPVQKGNPRISHNMLNTVFVAAMVAFILPLLYMFLWGPALRETIIETSLARYDRLGYPALALLEEPNWSSQAHISLMKKPKCFMGPYQDKLPPCQSESDVMSGCSCSSNWKMPLRPLAWANSSYNALELVPTGAETATYRGQRQTIQSFFSYKAQQAAKDRGELLKPSLYLALWDPRLELDQALELGVATLQIINANALTEVNLAPQLRQTKPESKLFVFDYGQSGISSVPAEGLQCDTSDGSTFEDYCQTSIFLQFQVFEVNVLRFRDVMVWTDVVTVAGAWISLFQIVAWIASGLALHAG